MSRQSGFEGFNVIHHVRFAACRIRVVCYWTKLPRSVLFGHLWRANWLAMAPNSCSVGFLEHTQRFSRRLIVLMSMLPALDKEHGTRYSPPVTVNCFGELILQASKCLTRWALQHQKDLKSQRRGPAFQKHHPSSLLSVSAWIRTLRFSVPRSSPQSGLKSPFWPPNTRWAAWLEARE